MWGTLLADKVSEIDLSPFERMNELENPLAEVGKTSHAAARSRIARCLRYDPRPYLRGPGKYLCARARA